MLFFVDFFDCEGKINQNLVFSYILEKCKWKFTLLLFFFQDIIPFGNHWLFRWVLGWMSPPKISFLKLTQTDVVKRLYTRTHTIQDLLPPLSALSKAISFFDELYHVRIF